MTRGHCLCKRTRWAFTGEIVWACYCHCDDCRRNCAAPVVGWFGVPAKYFEWVGDPPETYASSAGVKRHFCATCGSPVGFEAAHYAGGMHLYAASLEDPSVFRPTFHVHYESRLPWMEIADNLPKYEGALIHAPENPDYG